MSHRSRRRTIVPVAVLAVLAAATLVVVETSPTKPVTGGRSLAVGSAGGATPLVSPGTFGAPGSATLTTAVPGTSPTVVDGATDLGPVTGSNRMDVTLALPLRDRSALNIVFRDEYTRSSPGYHHFLTPASFDARFAPTQASVSAVTGWATKEGLDVVSVSSNRTLVQLSGTTARLSTALGTSFVTYRAKGGLTYITPTSTALLPAALRAQVSSVVGLSTLGRLGVSAPVSSPDAPADTTSSSGLLGGLLGGLLSGSPAATPTTTPTTTPATSPTTPPTSSSPPPTGTTGAGPTSGGSAPIGSPPDGVAPVGSTGGGPAGSTGVGSLTSGPTGGTGVAAPNSAIAGSTPATPPPPTPAAPSYGPAQVASLYNAPASDQGAGQTIADIDEGALGQVTQDLSTFEDDFGLPHVPVTVVHVGAASADTSSQTEWDLDAEYSTGLAPKVSGLILYDAHSLSDTDVLNALNAWVTQDRASEAGLSGGECESVAKADGVLGATDDALAEAVAQGQTLFVATGDQGAFCQPLQGGSSGGTGAQDLGVMYPASSPYAVAVGGTTVLTSAPLSEAAWPDSGGGVSTHEPEPPYQLPVVGPSTGRSIPDVSLDSSPSTGFECIVDGQSEVIGGTSAATQAWVGIWARVQQAHGGQLGFANIAIYDAPPSSFHDVTQGNNGFYSATPGYDLTTGRGTPDIAALVSGA